MKLDERGRPIEEAEEDLGENVLIVDRNDAAMPVERAASADVCVSSRSHRCDNHRTIAK